MQLARNAKGQIIGDAGVTIPYQVGDIMPDGKPLSQVDYDKMLMWARAERRTKRQKEKNNYVQDKADYENLVEIYLTEGLKGLPFDNGVPRDNIAKKIMKFRNGSLREFQRMTAVPAIEKDYGISDGSLGRHPGRKGRRPVPMIVVVRFMLGKEVNTKHFFRIVETVGKMGLRDEVEKKVGKPRGPYRKRVVVDFNT